ncbi:MAG: ABC transporter permease [Flavobacteriales bacterium]
MINIISGISVAGIALAVAAMIIILSAINGLEGLVDTLSSKFDSDIRITPLEGKSFDRNVISIAEIRSVEGVEAASEVVEELCVLKYGDNFVHGLLKGVQPEFLQVSNVRENMIDGDTLLQMEDFYFCMIDVNIAATLELYVSDRPGEFQSVTIFAPMRNKKMRVNRDPFNRHTLFLSGVFESSSDDELKPILVHRDLAATLLEYGESVSAYELRLKRGYDVKQVKRSLQDKMGDAFRIQTRYEQNEILHKVSESEKFFVMIMLSFVLLLTSFNILASLTMLVIDKKKDIDVLISMGADKKMIRTIFFSEGLMINFFGGFIGLLIGASLVLAQQYLHLIPLEGAVIDHYPVALKAFDFIWVAGIVGIVGVICSYVPVRFLVKRYFR